VKEHEAAKWAKNRNWDYFETSALEGKNVSESLEALFTKCIKQQMEDRRNFGID